MESGPGGLLVIVCRPSFVVGTDHLNVYISTPNSQVLTSAIPMLYLRQYVSLRMAALQAAHAGDRGWDMSLHGGWHNGHERPGSCRGEPHRGLKRNSCLVRTHPTAIHITAALGATQRRLP